MSVDLPGDSFDYDVLFNAAQSISKVNGLVCEIGVRRGGSLKYIIDGLNNGPYRHLIAIDPYGDIPYQASDTTNVKLDYSNDMKHESMANIYQYIIGKNINFIFFNLEDTEFFKQYNDGIIIYSDVKEVINTYALVFFDGPHNLISIQDSVDFFINKTSIGGIFVFDDVLEYRHDIIHHRLLDNGFKLLEVGKQTRKMSYQKIN